MVIKFVFNASPLISLAKVDQLVAGAATAGRSFAKPVAAARHDRMVALVAAMLDRHKRLGTAGSTARLQFNIHAISKKCQIWLIDKSAVTLPAGRLCQ